MGIGYIILALVLLLLLWVLIDQIKSKLKKGKADVGREMSIGKDLEPAGTAPAQNTTQTQQTTEQATQQTPTQTPTANTDQNKEKLVDDNGKIKVVD